MGIKDWLGVSSTGASSGAAVSLDEYLDGMGMHDGELLDEEKYTYVKSLNANTQGVINDTVRELKKGNIVVLDTENMSPTNRLGLKKLIADLKTVQDEIDGDMGRISESKILIVPGGYRVLKRRVE